MIVTIMPSQANGKTDAPPSKSMAHRLLICAGLAEGTSKIQNTDFSEDILATIDCLRALGAEISCGDRCVTVRNPLRTGNDLPETAQDGPSILGCRECGSTLRFMIPLCLMDGQSYLLRGSRTLFTRPLTVYEDICAAQGISFRKEDGQLTVSGRLSAGEYEIPGNISSQFVSGLLFALPLLDGDSRIRLLPPVESRSYIGMTMQAQEAFGVCTKWEDDLTIRIRGGQKYKAADTRVEGDYSNAAFFEALNLAGGSVAVEGLKENSLQGDRVYRQYFDRIKESDRGLAMRQELAKMGVTVETGENEILVPAGAAHFREGTLIRRPEEPLDGHNDHRIVMALAVMLTKTGGTIRGAEAVKKSLPDFWERLAGLGVEMRVEQELV